MVIIMLIKYCLGEVTHSCVKQRKKSSSSHKLRKAQETSISLFIPFLCKNKCEDIGRIGNFYCGWETAGTDERTMKATGIWRTVYYEIFTNKWRRYKMCGYPCVLVLYFHIWLSHPVSTYVWKKEIQYYNFPWNTKSRLTNRFLGNRPWSAPLVILEWRWLSVKIQCNLTDLMKMLNFFSDNLYVLGLLASGTYRSIPIKYKLLKLNFYQTTLYSCFHITFLSMKFTGSCLMNNNFFSGLLYSQTQQY